MSEQFVIDADKAELALSWLKSRGGIAVWTSVDLSDPGWEAWGPLRDADGKLSPKPSWKSSVSPSRVITDPDNIVCVNFVEVERFHVAVRLGSSGVRVKCTDASSRKIKKKLAKHSRHAVRPARYYFDYAMQECVIVKATALALLTSYIDAEAPT